jgi:hypothetical protein
MTATLGINDRVSETLGITIELKIMSQVANFINQILLFFIWWKLYFGDPESNFFSHAAVG